MEGGLLKGQGRNSKALPNLESPELLDIEGCLGRHLLPTRIYWIFLPYPMSYPPPRLVFQPNLEHKFHSIPWGSNNFGVVKLDHT